MSTQADVRSIQALKDFRVALALFGDDALAALGAVDMEVRRTLLWLQHDRRTYWQEQIKRRREQVATARAEVFRRKLGQRPDYAPAMSEQKELLRQAESGLREAETRAALVKKWEPLLQQAIFEYQASVRRIRDLAAGDVPRALALLDRLIDALEAYLRVAVPTGTSAPDPLASIADAILAEGPAPPEDLATNEAAVAPVPAPGPDQSSET